MSKGDVVALTERAESSVLGAGRAKAGSQVGRVGRLLEKVGISPRPSGGGAMDSRNSVGEGSPREGGSRAVGAGAGVGALRGVLGRAEARPP